MFGNMISNMMIKPGKSPVFGTPSDVGLTFEDVEFETSDGVRLRGWLIPGGSYPDEGRSRQRPALREAKPAPGRPPLRILDHRPGVTIRQPRQSTGVHGHARPRHPGPTAPEQVHALPVSLSD